MEKTGGPNDEPIKDDYEEPDDKMKPFLPNNSFQQSVEPGLATSAPPMPSEMVAPKTTPAMFKGVQTPVYCECPSCNLPTHTRVEVKVSRLQWIVCIILLLVGLWCFCCIPFYFRSLKAGRHYCKNCGALIGSFN
ncbi:unnamed protein product [Moneuplotes crassus]|uniref:LITAF domain-containing protein n=1 Tax=Euplotes crassus TaxID=5936 RepID=A0AAD1XU35_EUPCR|nr:unnamed protein product [Moneuplotes crassus]